MTSVSWLWFLFISSATGLTAFWLGKRNQKGSGPAKVDNRRRFPRVRPFSNQPILVQIIGEDFIERLRAKDISEGGVSVQVAHLFQGCKVEAEVDLIVTLPGHRPFQTKAEIRHTKKEESAQGTFGVKFLELKETQRDAISTFVDLLIEKGRLD